MPLPDLNNPDVIRFYTEECEKTAKLRMKWIKLHASQLKLSATFRHEEKGYREIDVLEKTLLAGMPTITRDHKIAGRNRRTKPKRDGQILTELKTENSIVNVDLGSSNEDPRLIRPATDLSFDPPMRPVDTKQESILYKKLPDFGRKVYLNNRSTLKPEERYYFSECSGWECGWRGGDSFLSKNAPVYGRTWSLTRDTMCRSGPQPNPGHYQSPEDLIPNRLCR